MTSQATPSTPQPFVHPGPFPPSPKGVPLIGALPYALKNPLQFFIDVKQQCGDLAYLKVGGTHIYIFTHPRHAQYIFRDNYRNFVKGGMWDTLRMMFGNGLVASDGDFWLMQRRMMQPQFHRQRLASLATMMTDAIQEGLERWEPIARRGEPLNISQEMDRFAMHVMVRTMFGSNITPSEVDEVGHALRVALDHMAVRLWTSALPHWVPVPGEGKFKQAMQTIDRMLYRVIERYREQEGESDNMLALLLAARDEETGQGMDATQLHDEALTLFVAGFETTAKTMGWVWYILSRFPDIARKLYAEVDSVLEGRVPGFEDLPKLAYTRMVIQETLRLYGPGYYLVRSVAQPDTIDGYPLAPKSFILIPIYLIHRHPDFWENPEGFDPERFATMTSVTDHRDFSYLPFNAGPRQCIGNQFAMMEAQFITALVCQRYHLDLLPGLTIQAKGTTGLAPNRDIIMTLRPRTKAE